MQPPTLLALSQHFPREKRSRRQPAWLGLEPARSRGSRGGLAPAAFLLAGIMLCPRRGWVSQETLPERSSDMLPGSRATLLGSALGLQDTGTAMHSSCIPLHARSISSLHHSRQTHCERLVVFTAPSSNLLPQQGPWEGSPGRKHLSAAFSVSAIPPSSSSLAACPDPSQGCSQPSPPADLSATHSGTGWTQTKANHRRKCCQSDRSWAPEPAPHAHPTPLQADTSPWSSPALLSLRVGNCSDALLAAAASFLPSSLFPRAEETSHSCTFISFQVKTFSPSTPPSQGEQGHPAPCISAPRCLSQAGRGKGASPGGSSGSLRDAIGQVPHKEGPRSQAPRKVSKPSCATRFAFSCQGDEFPLYAL